MKKYDLYLTGFVGGWGISADYVKYILDKKKDQPVDVAICSLGGYVTTGLEIYELFKNHGQVTCYFLGMSASAATFMAMGAKKVVMSKNALILIHNAMGHVFEWGDMNKEQLDELVERLQFQRSQLNTIDDVLAEIYAEKSGKPVDDVKAKMKVAAWIKAADAKDFGLVDEVTEPEQMPTNVRNIYTNSMIKDMGLPALPKGFNPETGEENPTAGVLQKVVEMLKGLMPEPTTDKSQNEMKITVFAALAALLAVKDGFEADEKGNVSLTQDQLKSVDDELKRMTDACKQATDTLKTQKAKIDQLEQEKNDLAEQVKNLKGSAGTKEEEVVDGAENTISAATELFNTIKDAL
jgi:ATP-dependent protease ClpP protease subunit/cell division protein FtsB